MHPRCKYIISAPRIVACNRSGETAPLSADDMAAPEVMSRQGLPPTAPMQGRSQSGRVILRTIGAGRSHTSTAHICRMLAVLKPWVAWTPNVPPWRRPPATARYRTDKRCVEAYCWLDQDSVLHWNFWSGTRGWTAQQWAISQGMMSHPSPDKLEDDHVPVDLGGSSFAVTRRTPKNPNSKKALRMMSSLTTATTLHTI
jgi:hypothetical protein